jgi:hypothetical protein
VKDDDDNDDQWFINMFFYGEVKEHTRYQCGPKKCFIDTLKASLKAFDIDPDTWESAVQDRTCWRSSVRTGAVTCEAPRNIAAERRRQARKDVVHQEGSIPCPPLQKDLQSEFGLASHMRKHKDK